jgi:hypothetical protein
MGALLQNTIFGKTRYKANTFIGGLASTLNSPALLASKLNISVSRIKYFKIVENDIECMITGGNYSPIFGAFLNSAITYFDDRDGLITTLTSQVFRYDANLSWVNLPNLTNLGDYNFQGSGLSSSITFPKLTTLGINCFAQLLKACELTFPVLQNISVNNFINPTSNTTINVPLSLATSNNGKPNPYLTTSSITRTLVNYIGYVEDETFNTEIGGLGQTLGLDRRLLCLKLAIGSGGVFNVRNDGGILKFKAVSNYGFATGAFSGDQNISFYDDSTEGMVKNIANNAFYNSSIQWAKFYGLEKVNTVGFGNSSFRNNPYLNLIEIPNMNEFNGGYWGRNCPNLQSISFPKLEKITNGAAFYADGNSIKNFYMPKLIQCGTNTGQESIFYFCKTGGTITVHNFLQTANAGSPDGDLVYASGTRGATIIYV